MSFNFALFIFFLLFSSQEPESDKTYDFTEILQKKESDYSSLHKKIKKITLAEINIFYEESISKNYKIGEIYALNSLGVYHKNKKDHQKALIYHNKALSLCKKHNFYSVQMICLNLIGITYKSQDDIRNAIVYHQSVLYLSKRIKTKTLENKKSISIAYNSLGIIYRFLKQYNLAIEQFTKAIIIQKETKDQYGLAISHQNIGKAYEHLDLLDEALQNYQTSLTHNIKLNSTLGKVICNNSIASIHIKKGNYAKSLHLLQEIYQKYKQIGVKFYQAETLANLGWVQIKLKEYESAYHNLNKALAITENINNHNFLHTKILYTLSDLFENKNELKKSLFYTKQAIKVENKISEKRNRIYIQNLTSKKNLQTQKHDFEQLQNITEIKSLQLARNRNILIITLITIALLTAVLYSVYRQHLLKNDQKILLLEQQALQTQMNPHFVFNALNSIKLYIINNEQKNAVYYLNKFSKLIRNILEVSKVKEVSLKEELSTMSLYMSIENIRFDNSINYTEIIPPNLNTDTIKLPPLVLQPFLENAIWHGLSAKENGVKEIVLNAEQISDELIEITIADNGIGRKAALDIKKNKSLKRKSVGIELTKERLTSFCNESLTEFSLNYYDLTDSDGNATGTKVSLQIPIILS